MEQLYIVKFKDGQTELVNQKEVLELESNLSVKQILEVTETREVAVQKFITPIKSTMISCPECSKEFKGAQGLGIHRASHRKAV